MHHNGRKIPQSETAIMVGSISLTAMQKKMAKKKLDEVDSIKV